ncbi:type VII secretion system-associated protein [Streptomyces canus]|uniref:type VII secretion system-associated protein n=1 Tax=Streptomyces canus TaxID=58343 RepID=UPI0033D47CDA
MPDDLTALDPTALTSFADNDVHGFHTDLVTLRTSTPDVKSLYDIGNSTQPLVIGQMAGDSDSGGKNVVSNVIKSAGAIDAVLNKHVTAFADLQRNLEDVVSTMTKAQQDNLSEVDGQKFLTAIAAYGGDIGGSGSSLSSTSTSTTT